MKVVKYKFGMKPLSSVQPERSFLRRIRTHLRIMLKFHAGDVMDWNLMTGWWKAEQADGIIFGLLNGNEVCGINLPLITPEQLILSLIIRFDGHRDLALMDFTMAFWGNEFMILLLLLPVFVKDYFSTHPLGQRRYQSSLTKGASVQFGHKNKEVTMDSELLNNFWININNFWISTRILRLFISVPCVAFGSFFIFMNYLVLINNLIPGRKWSSAGPFLGGIFLATGILLFPFSSITTYFWWVAFLLDYTWPMFIYFLLFIAWKKPPDEGNSNGQWIIE